MISMEVDENNDGGDDPKGESFLDEHNDNTKDNDNKSRSASLLNLPTSVKVMRRKWSMTITKKIGGKYFGNTTHMMLAIIVFAALLLLFSTIMIIFAKGRRKPVLRFRLVQENDSSSSSRSNNNNQGQQQTFKIMQITDIHLGEAEYTDWGPQQDMKTFALLKKVFDYEPDCDLLVLGGDQLTANNCLGNCTKYYDILGRFLSSSYVGVPWATIMGNHDDMAFEVEDGSGATIPHSNSLRRDLLRVDQKFHLSLSQESSSSTTRGEKITGVTNYVLDVLDPITNEVSLQIFFLDSGGGSLKEAINDDQIEWFQRQQQATGQQSKVVVPAVAFQHIPTWQYEYVNGGYSCFGYQGEDVASLQYDGGIVNAMIETNRFHFLAVGHNHGNDYCCSYSNDNGNDDNNNNNKNEDNDFYLCYGRHSGYGGYGNWERGVRIYELSYLTTKAATADDDDEEGELMNEGKDFRWRTWVRLESGEKVDFMDYDHSLSEEEEDGNQER